jgi:predicted DNA-binding transcriptional regulator AlpA
MKSKHRLTGTAGAGTITTAPTTILTVEQVATRLQIPKSSVYERTRFRGLQNTVPVIPHRRVGKYLRFVASEVDSWFLSLPQPTKKGRRAYRKARVPGRTVVRA